MWHLKFKVRHMDCIFSPLAKKYDLHIEFFPLGHYLEKGFLYTPSIQVVKGNERNIKKYLRDLKKNKRVVKVEVSKVIFCLTKEETDKETYKTIYDPKILYVTPGYNYPDGSEIWEVSSWDREVLQKLIQTFEKSKFVQEFEILRFEEKNLEDVYIISLFPKLPKKQKEAIELAYQEGYYSYPKKVNLDRLSQMVKVSKPTFQENLRKAESKLMPLLLRTK
jgi:predicted DNA binding protein